MHDCQTRWSDLWFGNHHSIITASLSRWSDLWFGNHSIITASLWQGSAEWEQLVGAQMGGTHDDTHNTIIMPWWVFRNIGGFDEAFPLPMPSDMLGRLRMLGRFLVMGDEGLAGVGRMRGSTPAEASAAEWFHLHPDYREEGPQSLSQKLRERSSELLRKGNVIRKPDGQTSGIVCRQILLEPPDVKEGEEEEEPDFSSDVFSDMSLQEKMDYLLKLRGKDLMAAAAAWPGPGSQRELAVAMPSRTSNSM